MSIERIILLVESPFNKRDYNRFGIERIRNQDIEVEVWDVSKIFHPRVVFPYSDYKENRLVL